jgi:molybdate transport system substrate-binding protein
MTMNRPHQTLTRVVIVIAAVVLFPTASFAQLVVITSGGFSAAYKDALPEFERTTGIRVTTSSGASQGSGPNTIGAQLRRGLTVDVVIMSKEGLNDLVAEGRIVAGTATDLAQAPLGLAVRAGAPRPDISSVETFKRTLLQAMSITFPASTTGIYMTTKLFPQLGIADELKAKTTTTGVAAVASGQAELAIQPVSELLHAAGVDFVGKLPAEVQYISVFSAAVVAGSSRPEAAKQLIAFFGSDRAKAAIVNAGMEPMKAR